MMYRKNNYFSVMKTHAFIIILSSLSSFFCTDLPAQSSKDIKEAKIKSIKKYSYNASEYEKQKLLDSVKFPEYYTYTVYHTSGKPKLIETYKSGKLFNKSFYTFNENGTFKKGTEVNSKEEITRFWHYSYGSNGHLHQVKSYTPDSILTRIQTTTYDKNGNNTELILDDIGRKDYSRYTSKYDKNNNRIQDFYYQEDSLMRKAFNTYNKNNNLIKKHIIRSNGKESINVYHYDSDNNLISELPPEKDNPDNGFTYSHEFENNGIWNVKRTIWKEKLNRIDLREITYYN